MTNKRRPAMVALTMMIIVLLLSPAAVCAETVERSGECVYKGGSTIESDFTSEDIARAISDLQPGDDVTYVITYTNSDKDTTDWYMENKVFKTLEKTAQSSKVVSGTGKAEHGGYTYELIHYDKNDVPDKLFTNREVGGDTTAAGMEGLEQATNALDEWFFIQTLDPGEHGTVVLNVAFEGETEVNDYMDTDGEVRVRFAVEKTAPEGGSGSGKKVKTGDFTNLTIWISALVAAGILLLILALFSMKRDRRDDRRTGGEA